MTMLAGNNVCNDRLQSVGDPVYIFSFLSFLFSHFFFPFIYYIVYLVSTNKKCIAAYPSTKKTPQKTARPITSFHRASTSNPKLERMADPGTSMLRPYFLSTRER